MKNIVSFSLLFTVLISAINAQDTQKIIKIEQREQFKNRMNFEKKNFDFETALKSADKFTSLNLRGKSLEYLDRRISAFQNLEVLDLSNNSLSSLPEEISTLKKLRIINLYNNKFSEFPKILLKLDNIESIDVSKNSIKVVILDISQNSKLKKLILSENHVDSINFTKTNNVLEELYLSNCKLNYIPSTINTLKSLKLISLNGNSLTTINHSLQNLKSLEKLNLSTNKFSSFPDISNFPNLSFLDLSNNQIEQVVFQSKVKNSLKSLILVRNNLSNFAPGESLARLGRG